MDLLGRSAALLSLLASTSCAHLPSQTSDSACVILLDPDVGIQPSFRIDRLERDLKHGNWEGALDQVELIAGDYRLIEDSGMWRDPPSYLIDVIRSAAPQIIAPYRIRFDDRALDLRQRGMTLDEWMRYFFCTGMDVEGSALANRFMDEGRAGLAAEIWCRLIESYPDSSIPREILCGRAMLAAALVGNLDLLDRVPSGPDTIYVGREMWCLDGWKSWLQGTPRSGRVLTGPPRLPEHLHDGVLAHRLERGTVWIQELQTPRGSLRLFTAPAHLRDFVGMAAFPYGTHTAWITSTGLCGLIDLGSLRQVWVGPLDRSPLSATFRRELKNWIAHQPEKAAQVNGWLSRHVAPDLLECGCRRGCPSSVAVAESWFAWTFPCVASVRVLPINGGRVLFCDKGDASRTTWPPGLALRLGPHLPAFLRRLPFVSCS